MDITQQCKVCNTVASLTSFFCSQCGAKLKSPPLSTTIGKQVLIYVLSFFLAPLGLFWYGIKYVRSEDPKARNIGIVVIVLTILSIVLTLWTAIGALDAMNKAINSQFTPAQFKNVGY